MKFHNTLLEPDYARSPDFVGWNLDEANFQFDCGKCSRRITIAYQYFVDLFWRWEDRLGQDLVDAAKTQFRLNIVGRSHDGGWPTVTVANCNNCGSQHLVYAGVNEISNSYYQITVQGILRFDE